MCLLSGFSLWDPWIPGTNDLLHPVLQQVPIGLPGLGVGGSQLHSYHVQVLRHGNVSHWKVFLSEGAFPSAKRQKFHLARSGVTVEHTARSFLKQKRPSVYQCELRHGGYCRFDIVDITDHLVELCHDQWGLLRLQSGAWGWHAVDGDALESLIQPNEMRIYPITEQDAAWPISLSYGPSLILEALAKDVVKVMLKVDLFLVAWILFCILDHISIFKDSPT